MSRVGSSRVGSAIFQIPWIGSRHPDPTRPARIDLIREKPCKYSAAGVASDSCSFAQMFGRFPHTVQSKITPYIQAIQYRSDRVCLLPMTTLTGALTPSPLLMPWVGYFTPTLSNRLQKLNKSVIIYVVSLRDVVGLKSRGYCVLNRGNTQVCLRMSSHQVKYKMKKFLEIKEEIIGHHASDRESSIAQPN